MQLTIKTPFTLTFILALLVYQCNQIYELSFNGCGVLIKKQLSSTAEVAILIRGTMRQNFFLIK